MFRKESLSCMELRKQHQRVNRLYNSYPIHSKHHLRFLHIPKNAGSSITKKHFSRFEIDKTKYSHPNINCSYWHIPPRFWKPKDPYRGGNVFCVARNPVDRALSEFKMRHPKQLNDPNILATAEKWLMSTMRRVYQHGDTGVDCHLLAQYLYIWDDDGRQTCQHVISFEEDDIAMAYNSLLDRYRSSMKRMNRRRHVAHHAELVYPLTSANLSSKVVQEIQRVYWKDMCLLGYDLNSSNASLSNTIELL